VAGVGPVVGHNTVEPLDLVVGLLVAEAVGHRLASPVGVGPALDGGLYALESDSDRP